MNLFQLLNRDTVFILRYISKCKSTIINTYERILEIIYAAIESNIPGGVKSSAAAKNGEKTNIRKYNAYFCIFRPPDSSAKIFLCSQRGFSTHRGYEIGSESPSYLLDLESDI